MKINRQWNPLTLADDHLVIDVDSGLTPNQIIDQAGLTFVRPFYLLVNGEPLGRVEWDSCQIKESDVCHFVELPGVSGLAALITTYLMAAMNTAAGIAAMSTAAVMAYTAAGYIIATGLVMGGLNLLNGFFAKTASGPSSIGQTDEVYAISSGSNRRRIDSPYAEQFGRLKVYPDLASAPYVEYSGAINQPRFADHDLGMQYLYFLGVIGVGEYDVEKVQIDRTNVDDMPGVEYAIIPPGNTDLIPYHRSIVYTVDTFNGQRLNQGWDAGYEPLQCVINPPGQASIIGYLAFDIVFPAGLYYQSGTGDRNVSGVFIRARARKIDDNGNPVSEWLNPLWVNDALSWNAAQAEIQGLFIGGIWVQEVRATFHVAVPAGWGRYELSIGCIDIDPNEPKHINDCYLGQIRGFGGYHTDSWVGADLSDCTLLAMKVRADTNLTGAISDKINVICTRKLYPVTTLGFGATKAATRNPVDAVAYMVTSDNGGKQPESVINWEAMAALRAEIETAGWYYDYRFQTRMSVMEACTQAAKCARAVPYMPGKFLLIQDQEKLVPSMKFTAADYTENSFALTHNIRTADDPTGVRVKFINAETWSDDEVDCYDEDGSDQNLAIMPIDGCTSRDQAYALGMYFYYDDKANRSQVEFETGLQGHIPLPGDRVLIDLPSADGWQHSGLIQSVVVDGGATWVYLSENIDPQGETAGKIYITGANAALLGPYDVILPATADNVVICNTLPAVRTIETDAMEATRYLLSIGTDDVDSMRVCAVMPAGRNNIRISGNLYNALPYTPVETTPISVPQTLLDTVSLFYSGPSNDNLYYNYALGWTGSATAIKLEIDEGTGFQVEQDPYESSTYNFQIADSLTIQVKVTAYDGGVLDPAFSITRSYTVPGTVTGLALDGEMGEEYTLLWDAVANATAYKITFFVAGQERGSIYSTTTNKFVSYADSLSVGGPYADFTVHVAAMIDSDLGKYASLDIEYDGLAPNYLVAVGQPYAILLQFLYQASDNIEAIEVWMSSTELIADAVMIGEILANEYRVAGLGIGEVRYFWIRCRYSGGVYSDYYPDEAGPGVMGIVSTDPAAYLIELTGSITEEDLFAGLRSRIDLVDRDWWYAPGYLDSGYFQGLNLENLSRAQEIIDLSATVNDPATGVTATANAVSLLSTDVADLDGDMAAIAQDVTTLESTVGDNSSSISQNATAIATLDGDVKAEYSLWLDVNGNITGFRSMIDHTGSSDFDIVSDSFRIINQNSAGDYIVPFAVGNIDGISTVGINGNLVVDGTILARRIVSSDLVTVSTSKSVTPIEVTAVLSVGVTLTDSNTNVVFNFTATNTTGVQRKILFVLTGRSGVTSGDFSADSQAFSIFKSTGGTPYFQYGWSPAGQDAKAATFTYVMAPTETSVMFYVRTAKTANNSYDLFYDLQVSAFGARN